MRKIISIALSFALIGGLSVSCVGDLIVTPIDPNIELPEDVLNSEAAYTALLAKCYQGLSVSSSAGEEGGPDIDGIDGGFGQYIRALFNMQELTTDVATCCWNDKTLFDIHNLNWTSSDTFVNSMYYRVFFQIGLCNEFIRRSMDAKIDNYPNKDAYIAEARALRILSYYHAIDMFGNVPFTTENDTVGSTNPKQISRTDLFAWIETEAKALLESNALAEPSKNEYGRCDKGMVMMILAKLYLNAEVWAGEERYADCADVCEDIIAAYGLADNYAELFCADNHRHTANTTYNGKEIIFAVQQDGIYIRSHGATNFLIKASGNNAWGDQLGTNDCWAGLSLTKAFTSKFDDADARAMFYKGDAEHVYDQEIDALRRESDSWSNGWKSMKFTNINHDGTAASDAKFVDTDFPLFRSADAYLMYAECAARGAAEKAKGQEYLNAIRTRAGVAGLELTTQNVLDERARELYYEGFRRQDLIRYGQFTTSEYLWEFKGGEQKGVAVDDKYNLFPLASGDVNANGNLTQNKGY